MFDNISIPTKDSIEYDTNEDYDDDYFWFDEDTDETSNTSTQDEPKPDDSSDDDVDGWSFDEYDTYETIDKDANRFPAEVETCQFDYSVTVQV